jgi:hypothetical protein
MMAPCLEGLLVKVLESELAAESRDLLRRFVIARQHPQPLSQGRENLAAIGKAALPTDEIPRANVDVSLGGGQRFEPPQIIVDIGKDLDSHDLVLGNLLLEILLPIFSVGEIGDGA